MKQNMSIEDLTGDDLSRYKNVIKSTSSQIRCCMPAIIKSINYDKMTIEATMVIRESVRQPDGEKKSTEIPTLLDVPLVFPSSTKYCITFPLSIGDEVLIVFADMCIDTWWQNGGVQDPFENRRHDLSDAIAIPSQMSQIKKITNFNSNYLEIRNNASGIKIEVQDDEIYLNGVAIKKLKNDHDALQIAHNQLRQEHDALKQSHDQLRLEFNQLRNSYNSHKHVSLVAGVMSGADSVSTTSGTPI